ncbi:MAG TPA: vitamin K epoxide reductase family protein [Candidatus Limnocylindrales bacterium]|nr:vitamin K epoxide reductase family protein [Candidatus Limnocylindrales bacterium]
MTERGRGRVLVVLAGTGLLISLYLTAFQVGLVASVWDPLFGSGSERVLTSNVSRLLPVPDASLGAVAYGVDAVLAAVVAFAAEPPPIAVALLAVIATIGATVALVLVVLQPLVARSLCSLCLASAALSVGLAVGALGEARERLLDPSATTRHSEVSNS